MLTRHILTHSGSGIRFFLHIVLSIGGELMIAGSRIFSFLDNMAIFMTNQNTMYVSDLQS